MVTRCKLPQTKKISEKMYGNACGNAWGNAFKIWERVALWPIQFSTV